MKMVIDGLTIEGTETAFDVLRSKYETYSMAFHELAKMNNNAKCFVDVEIELHNKAQAIAEYLGGVENDE